MKIKYSENPYVMTFIKVYHIFAIVILNLFQDLFRSRNRFGMTGSILLIKNIRIFFFFSLALPFPTSLFAAKGGISGETLSLWWTLPFMGMLASLALMPLFAKPIWEAHYGKIALSWSLITLLSIVVFFPLFEAQQEILGTLFHHYLPFVIMIGALYAIAGGIHLQIEAHATPLLNTGLLAIGAFLAGWIGTTGASMLLIRPLIHINKDRKYRIHHMIFFIFLVANIGGALTPLGDPPLFIGFLNEVNFFWPLKNLFWGWLIVTLPLLALFYGLDYYYAKKEGHHFRNKRVKVKIHGGLNSLLFLGVIGLVLFSGLRIPNFYVHVVGVPLEIQDIIRDIGLLLLATLSWFYTPADIHKMNHFSWEPLFEVVKLFFGVFMTAIPVIAILDAGLKGTLAPLISLVGTNESPHNKMYFWLTGGLSALLDNAPTYLVFFHMAGGDASLLMSSLTRTLEAISLGAVFMGAMTYIGNAPNFMVKAIAESQRIQMPSFFGYLIWSTLILFPLFLFLSWWRF